MRQNPNHKRPRNRGNLGGRKPSNNRNQTFDSNGPSVRIRGNAFQVHEKYLTLARDAYSSGDRVMAENYFQHAEHYYRIVNATTDPNSAGQRINGQSNGYHPGSNDDEEFEDTDEYGRPIHNQAYGGRGRPDPRESQPGQRAESEGDDERSHEQDRNERYHERTADRGPERAPGRSPERSGEQSADANARPAEPGGDRQGGERGERRRRGRRSNGHEGSRRDDDGGRVGGEASQHDAATAVDPAPAAPAPAHVEPPVARAADADIPEAAERPRRRPRRRPPADAAGEAPGRDADEEPVLI